MQPHAVVGPWVYLVPLIVVAMLVRRNLRQRRLRVERLWITPLAFLVLTLFTFAAQPPPGPPQLAIDVAAIALGAFAGWWRGRFTRITVDPTTHDLTSKTSAVGMVLILALFVARAGLRSYGARTFHIPVREITDALMLLAVGLVCAQRLEIALRATRMLKEARAGSAR